MANRLVKKMNVLKELDFQQSDFCLSKNNIFKYDSNLGILYFIKMKYDEKLDQLFYDVHRDIWNENKSETFITIIDENRIIICDSKIRPDPVNPIENVKIKSFEYGENTDEAQEFKGLLKKENIDNGFFWEEISRFIKERNKKRSPIDDDLLNNLLKRRNNLIKILKDDENDVSQKLIDRCLFIRFIEDRLTASSYFKLFLYAKYLKKNDYEKAESIKSNKNICQKKLDIFVKK